MKKVISSFISVALLLVLSTSAYGQDYEFVLKWGSYGSGNGQFNKAGGIAIDLEDNVYVTDHFNHRIQKFDSNGNFITQWGGCGSGNGQFNTPYGVAVDSEDNVYVADQVYSRIQKFDSEGNFITKWGIPGSGNGQLLHAYGLIIDSEDNVYVADTYNHRVQKFSSEDGVNYIYVTKWGSYGSGDSQFKRSYGVAVDSQGNVYVADTDNHRIQKFDSEGGFFGWWGLDSTSTDGWHGPGSGTIGVPGAGDGQFVQPIGLIIDSEDNVYVADTYNHRIQKFDSDGNFITKWGGYGSGDGQFERPCDLDIDSQGNVYVSGYDNCRIQKFAVPYTEVAIDIKPGSDPNSINLGSNGKIPVAIFSTTDFDATTVDPSKVTLGGASVVIKGKGTPMASFDDIDGDGLLDIIVHVDTQGLSLTPDDKTAELEGETYGGKKIRGKDTVRIVH
jgi:streptogramin lyase